MHSILIIKLGAIGDVLRTTSILRGLRKKYAASITWLTKSSSYELLKNNELIDNLVIFEKHDKFSEKFDLVINLDDDKAACTIASETLSHKIIGAYLKDGKTAYTDDSAPWFDMGLISRFGRQRADKLKKENKKTYQEILGEILDIDMSAPILNLNEKSLEFPKDFANKNGIKEDDMVIGLNTSAGKRWKQKRLSIDKTVELINALNNNFKVKLLLFGGQEEVNRNKEILKKSGKTIINAGCKNSLLEFASLINLCDLIITSDSLAMNIAIALKKKVVVFFGPTSAAEIELYGKGKKIVPDMECICCYRKECDKKPNCMDKIEVKAMIEAVKGCLS